MPSKEPQKKELTETEKVILKLISEDFLTIKQIQIRRKCTKQAIYKILKSLRKKGYLNLSNNKVDFLQSTNQPNLIRLHSQEFNIKLLFQDQRYQKSIEKSNILFIEGHTIRLYNNSIEIYAGKGISFFGNTTSEADNKSLEYWKRFFIRLESDLNVIILKDRSRNIKEVNHHYARGNSEICENSIDNNSKIRVFCPIDNKLWFITDDSFGNKEDETIHPITAKIDRNKIDKQVNDWRLYDPPTNSQLASNLNDLIKATQIIANNLDPYNQKLALLGQQIEAHLNLIQSYRKEAEERNRVYEEFFNSLKQAKTPFLTKLKEWFKAYITKQ